jgi:sulfide dehydrogenase cytochrome subunit
VKAAKGKAIHACACDKCHTEGGSVVEDDAGILAG